MNQPFVPGPPPLDSGARTRAFLYAGSRTRVSTTKKLIIVVVLIVLVVGGCAAAMYTLFASHLGTGLRISEESNGEIRSVLILGSSSGAVVTMILAPNVSTLEANRLICQLVLPELANDGIHASTLSVGDGLTGRTIRDPASGCPGGVPNS